MSEESITLLSTPSPVKICGPASGLAVRLRQQSLSPLPLCLQNSSKKSSTTALLTPLKIETTPIKKCEILKKCQPGEIFGEKLPAQVNYVRVSCDLPDCVNGLICQHHVAFDPEVDASHRAKIMCQKAVLDETGQAAVFDGGSALFLPQKHGNIVNRIIKTNHPVTKQPLNVIVTFTKMVEFEKCSTSLVNGIIGKLMDTLEWTRVGEHYYNENDATRLGQYGLEIWPGVALSCKRDKDGGLVVEVDISSFRFRRLETVWDLMQSIANKDDGKKEATAANGGAIYKDECLRQLLNQVATTWYNNQTYKIEDIDWKRTPESTFGTSKNGSRVTFVEHYRDQFGVEIKDKQQPLLVTKIKSRPRHRSRDGSKKITRKTARLVPELCHLTLLSKRHRSDFNLMRQVSQFTHLTPAQRVKEIRRFLGKIASNEQCRSILAAWHLSLAHDLIRVDGHVLKPEKICTQDAVFDQRDYDNGDFSRCFETAQPLVTIPLNEWAIIYDRRLQQSAVDLIGRFVEIGRENGLRIDRQPQRHVVGSGTEKTRTIEFIHAIRKIKQEHDQRPVNIVVVLLTSPDRQDYVTIKQECNLAGLVSQCIIARKLMNNASIYRHIFMQMQVKMGAELWGVPMPDVKLGGLMGVGLDVYHDPNHGPSWAALVGSLNQTQTRYYNVVCRQLPGEEATHGLALGFVRLLTAYRQVNGCLPSKVIVFRDGLGSSQFEMSQEFEVTQIREAFKSVNYSPEFVFIVCVKRIGVRIFSNSSTTGHPPPGLVVDRVIGEPNWYDFYLASKAFNGCISTTPVHYVVIEDTSRYSRSQIQRLVWKFTHLAYNRAATARQPAPAVYADRLAYMVGHILKREPHASLCDKLFYL